MGGTKRRRDYKPELAEEEVRSETQEAEDSQVGPFSPETLLAIREVLGERWMEDGVASSIQPSSLLVTPAADPDATETNQFGGTILSELSLSLAVNGHPILPLDPSVDALELWRSASAEGEYWIFTCTCGVPQCLGIEHPVTVLHRGGSVLWIDRNLPKARIWAFPREAYVGEILRAVGEPIQNEHQGRKLSRP